MSTQTESGHDVAGVKQDYRSAVRSAWAKFKELAATEQRQDLQAHLEPMIRRFELGIFRLVVMGEIKKGKSSFINALLGEHDLLPTQTDIATSTVYKVLYGPQKKLKVFFQPDIDTGKRQAPLEIAEGDLSAYGMEDGNPGNEKRVDFIGVELPNAMLKKGLVLVDTPGVGGLFKAHRDISWRYAPNADAVFFVLDSVEAVISKDEIQFLHELTSKITKRVFFIQTKTDVADTEQWQAWQARNKQILSEKLGIAAEQLYYFPVSSKLKHIADERHDGARLADSGFLAVLDFMHHGLMEAKDRQLARGIAHRLEQGGQQIARGVQEQLQLYQGHSKEELNRLRQDYCGVKVELEQWSRTTYQEQVQRFSDEFTDIRQKSAQQLQDELDPGGPNVTNVINKLRTGNVEPEKLAELAKAIQQEWLALAAQRVGQLQRDFNTRVSTLLSEICTALSVGTDDKPVASVLAQQQNMEFAGLTVEDLVVHFGQFEAIRTSMYGGMAGAMMSNIAVGLLSFVIPPVAAVAGIAAIAGAVIGGSLVGQDLTCRRREEALMKLQGILQNLARRCQRQAVNRLTDIAASYERHARDTFRGAADQAQKTLQLRLSQLEEAGSRTREENRAKSEQLQHRLQSIADMQQSLQLLLGKTKDAGSRLA